jgi:hypothetical protein
MAKNSEEHIGGKENLLPIWHAVATFIQEIKPRYISPVCDVKHLNSLHFAFACNSLHNNF